MQNAMILEIHSLVTQKEKNKTKNWMWNNKSILVPWISLHGK